MKKFGYFLFYVIALAAIIGSYFLGQKYYDYCMTHSTMTEKLMAMISQHADEYIPQDIIPTTETQEEVAQPPQDENVVYSSAILAQGNAVTSAYISSSLFLGDSRTVSLQEGGVLSARNIFAEAGLTPSDYLNHIWSDSVTGINGTIDQIIAERKPRQVYIMLGTNGVGFMNESTFDQSFANLITRIHEEAPNTSIVIVSILPVNEQKVAETEKIENAAIQAANLRLIKVAEDNDAYFLAIYDQFAEGTGNLSSNYDSGDGIHLNVQGCQELMTQIKNHPVPGWVN